MFRGRPIALLLELVADAVPYVPSCSSKSIRGYLKDYPVKLLFSKELKAPTLSRPDEDESLNSMSCPAE